MKYYSKIILLICLTLCGYSCNILDENPYDFASPDKFFNTKDEVKSALYGVYGCLHNQFISDAENIMMGDLGVDIMDCRSQPDKNVFRIYLMEAPTNEYSTTWHACYSGVAAANMVINRTQNTDMEPSFKNQIIAEAMVMRAIFYHKLILMWGDVPFWTNELNLDEVSKLGRTSKKEIVEQLSKDLVFAGENLPESYSQEEAGRITKWGAIALHARICLLENDWQQAYDLSNDVITNSPHKLLPVYNDVFDWSNKFNDELILVIPSLFDVQGSRIHSFSAPRARDEGGKVNGLFKKGLKAIRPDGKQVNQAADIFRGWGMFVSTEGFLNSFEEGDIRRDIMDWHTVTMSDGTVVTLNGGDGGCRGHYTLKWAAFESVPNNGDRDLHYIRLAEMFLIRAEAANEIGKTEEAISSLNILRERAFGDDSHALSTSLSKDEIKKAIINEHKWELGGEGLRRWYLNHWGFEYLKAAVESIKDENPKAAENIKPHHVLFKIPAEEYIKNPNLGNNNPGY